MIKTKDLQVRFADGSAIRYGNLCFEAGQSYALLGASGCGKSTLLNLLAGVLTPASGTVEIDGAVASAWSQRQKDAYRIRNIGFIFQDFKLLEDMTVADNIGVLRLEGVNTAGMDALLERLGLLRLKKRRVRQLSGGEKQRVAIARALIKRPALILADDSGYGYATQASTDYFPGLIRRVQAVGGDGLKDLTDIISDAQSLEQYARGELAAKHYRYDEAADKYVLDNNDGLYDRFYEVYGRFSQWLTRYEL